MSAGLEFHWPGTAQTASFDAPPARSTAAPNPPPSANVVEAVLSRLLEAGPAQLVALADKADCERRLHATSARVDELERTVRALRAELAEANSALMAQRLHIDALNTELKRRQRPVADDALSLKARLLPSAHPAGAAQTDGPHRTARLIPLPAAR